MPRSVDDLDGMDLAPIAQGPLRRLVPVVMPGIDRSPSGEQGLELLIGASLAEEITNLVQIIRQQLADEGDHKRLAEVEISRVRDPQVLGLVFDIVRQFVVFELLQVILIELVVDLSRLPADEGVALPYTPLMKRRRNVCDRPEEYKRIILRGNEPSPRPEGSSLGIDRIDCIAFCNTARGPSRRPAKHRHRPVNPSVQKYSTLPKFGFVVCVGHPSPPKGRSYVVSNAGWELRWTRAALKAELARAGRDQPREQA
jgi:hypothetical protein